MKSSGGAQPCICGSSTQDFSVGKSMETLGPNRNTYGSLGIPGSRNGGTLVPYETIFDGDFPPLHRPEKIGLPYGRYLQFRFLKWPLNGFYNMFFAIQLISDQWVDAWSQQRRELIEATFTEYTAARLGKLGSHEQGWQIEIARSSALDFFLPKSNVQIWLVDSQSEEIHLGSPWTSLKGSKV